MSVANELEQLMLNLINQERTNANLAPLTFDNDLNEASEDHSSWMLDTDTFSHTGQNGSSAGDRIVDAGYELEGNWTWGENIGWQSERGEPGLEDDVRDIHQSLMNSPGHRANILNPDFEEIGIGIENGDFENFDSVMITQNFGATDTVSDDPDEEEPPVSEGPIDEVPDEEEPPVAEGPDEETPDEEEPPVAEGPDEEVPDEEEPPVAEGPDEEIPDEEEPPVAEGPDEEVPDEEEPPVAEGPDEEIPDEEEPPVAEGPDEEIPDEEPPVAEGPGEDMFDVEQFLADLGDMLSDLFDSFEFIASNDCDDIEMDDQDPMVVDLPEPEQEMDEDDMEITCGDWSADDFDFQVSVDISFNFDLA